MSHVALRLLTAIVCLLLGPREVFAAAPQELKRLSLEELLETEFVSLSKKPERRSQAPAAVSIITAEDIRRSGATSIPDALRLAPGIHVARIDANKWAIGTRGFASRLARSQLTLMDGRSLYTPLFAGTYWEVQDTFLEDLDRIEVIRGPGGTLWGANAVNGIVNILTRSAKDTQGVVLTGGAGTEERGFGGFRYGGRLGDAVHFRVYGKYFDRDAGRSPGAPDFDDWRMGQVGFRSDTDLPGGDLLTIQGDLYEGESGQRATLTRFSEPFTETVQRDTDFSGGNLLGRWTRAIGESELTVQTYYDRTFRREPIFREERDTFDFDLQHRLRAAARHDVVWGLGYRLSADRTGAIPTIEFRPDDRELSLVTAFVQDEISLLPDVLRLVIGSKFEHNDFSGFEFQPSSRLLWTPGGSHVVWAGFTHAVRTPSRVEDDLVLHVLLEPETPTFARLVGDGGFEPEKVLAWEAGYRVEPMTRVFLDVAGFFNRHEDFLSIEPGAPFSEEDRVVVPFVLRNRVRGDSYGGEVQVETEPLPDWRVRGGYSYLQLDFRRKPGSQDPTTVASTEGSSPHHQLSLGSSMTLASVLEVDLWFRYVDNLPAQNTGSYATLDARLAWFPRKDLELELVGQNLAERSHLEFGGASTEVERGVYGAVTWRW